MAWTKTETTGPLNDFLRSLFPFFRVAPDSLTKSSSSHFFHLLHVRSLDVCFYLSSLSVLCVHAPKDRLYVLFYVYFFGVFTPSFFLRSLFSFRKLTFPCPLNNFLHSQSRCFQSLSGSDPIFLLLILLLHPPHFLSLGFCSALIMIMNTCVHCLHSRVWTWPLFFIFILSVLHTSSLDLCFYFSSFFRYLSVHQEIACTFGNHDLNFPSVRDLSAPSSFIFCFLEVFHHLDPATIFFSPKLCVHTDGVLP